MRNISQEAKLNFAFYCSWVLLGLVIGLWCIVLAIALASSFFFILGSVFSFGGLFTATAFYARENSDTQKLSRWFKNPKQKKHNDKVFKPSVKKEKIPEVEIFEEPFVDGEEE